jgi:gluconokinase
MTTIIVMGVAGCGKSTFGQALALRLQLPWIEGDDYHSASSKAKMAAGIPLQDADRADWLQTLAQLIGQHSQGCVIGCSALKRPYRDVLRVRPDVRFAYLALTREQAQARVSARQDHFFADTLVSSQFATLEPPLDEHDVITLEATADLQVLVNQALQALKNQA